jgi:hypothetical protein
MYSETTWATQGMKRAEENDKTCLTQGTSEHDVIIAMAGQPKALVQV